MRETIKEKKNKINLKSSNTRLHIYVSDAVKWKMFSQLKNLFQLYNTRLLSVFASRKLYARPFPTRSLMESNLGRIGSLFELARGRPERMRARFRERLQIYSTARSASGDVCWMRNYFARSRIMYFSVNTIYRIVCWLLAEGEPCLSGFTCITAVIIRQCMRETHLLLSNY